MSNSTLSSFSLSANRAISRWAPSDATGIASITGLEVLDSRGFPTVAATVTLCGGISGTAMVPSGASTGEFEAHELRDNDKSRYLGKGVAQAVKIVEEVIAPELLGRDVRDLSSIDRLLCSIDGTDFKSKLGANAILGVSIACAHAGANASKLPLYRYLGGNQARRLPTSLVMVGLMLPTDLIFKSL
jgi:enolase